MKHQYNIFWIDSKIAQCSICDKKQKCIARDHSVPDGYLCRTCFDDAVAIDRVLTSFYGPSGGGGDWDD